MIMESVEIYYGVTSPNVRDIFLSPPVKNIVIVMENVHISST